MLQKVHLDRALPIFETCDEKSLGGWTTGIGNANIDAAKLFDHGGDESRNGRSVGYVASLGKDFRAVLLLIWSAADCKAVPFRAHIATRHPSAAKASAVARPIPWLDAATTATRSFIPKSMDRDYKRCWTQEIPACSAGIQILSFGQV